VKLQSGNGCGCKMIILEFENVLATHLLIVDVLIAYIMSYHKELEFVIALLVF